ncbi:MAG: sodium:proton antiporter [Planctomycetota bacterium]|jgi:multicomponent Na+:H+ antiporter subunit C
MGLTVYMLAFALLLVGVYGVIAKRNVIKIILGILIIDYAVNMLLVLVGYRRDGVAPILSEGQDARTWAASAVDPLPQAMVLTSIVIGLGLAAMMVALAIRLYQKYGTFDMNEIRRLKG